MKSSTVCQKSACMFTTDLRSDPYGSSVPHHSAASAPSVEELKGTLLSPVGHFWTRPPSIYVLHCDFWEDRLSSPECDMTETRARKGKCF